MISSNFGHSRLAHSLRKKRLGTGGINLILIPPHPVPASSWNVQELPRRTGNDRTVPSPTDHQLKLATTLETDMPLTSHEIQRELTWLFDARYKLNPCEFRPDGACPKTLPRISVLREADSYVVTLTWEFTEAVSSISASEAKELLRQQSRQLIDRALRSHFGDRQYIRRPLFDELEISEHPQAVIVTPLSTSQLGCELLMVFPWQSENEFCCADSNVIEGATRLNKMISAGTAQFLSFPACTLVPTT
jgi:hypothetical protein